MNNNGTIAKWFLMRNSPGPASWNMAVDEILLEEAASIGAPLLRLYGWIEPAATFGYFQKYAEIAAWTQLRPLVRRPTGGGLVPHDHDWTYTLVFPPLHPWHELRAEESYEKAHAWVADSFKRLSHTTTLASSPVHEAPGQCFIGAEKFDVLLGGKKIAGAAQRRNKNGLLIQGSVQSQPSGVKREAWEEAFLKEGTERFQVEWEEFQLPARLNKMAAEVARKKYSRKEYNEKR